LLSVCEIDVIDAQQAEHNTEELAAQIIRHWFVSPLGPCLTAPCHSDFHLVSPLAHHGSIKRVGRILKSLGAAVAIRGGFIGYDRGAVSASENFHLQHKSLHQTTRS
jgi:hypothetical protein